MSTIRDVAKEAGLSTGTISKALSNPASVSKKSLAKVDAAIKKLNYKPNMLAQKFRSKQTYTIVVLVPDIANLFFAQVISGIENIAQKKGYSVLLGDTKDSPEREKQYIRMVETRLAEGIINLRPHNKENAILPMEGVVAVCAGGCEKTPYPSVRIDNAGAAEKAVDFLHTLGHRKIGIISGLESNPHSVDRLKGVRRALEKNGLPFDERLYFEGDFNFWSGLNGAEYFLQLQDRPTAIFCMNDEMAIGAMKGYFDAGLSVPQDISIVGFDDMQVSRYINPALTSIAQPAEKIGEKSAEVLFQIIEGTPPSREEFVLPHDFIIRDSTRHLVG